jgi:hypothetical protein
MMFVVFNSAKLFQSQMARKKLISAIFFVYYSVFVIYLVILFVYGLYSLSIIYIIS